MIKTPNGCYYQVTLNNCILPIVEMLSPESVDDIKSGVICSGYFETDVEALCALKEHLLNYEGSWEMFFNQLYLPNNKSNIEALMEENDNGQYEIKINPYEIYTLENEILGITAMVCCDPFEMPDRTTIIKNTTIGVN